MKQTPPLLAAIGFLRMTAHPDETVAAVTIAKSMGSEQDVLFLKSVVTWRAVPGPSRVVDVPWQIEQYYYVKAPGR